MNYSFQMSQFDSSGILEQVSKVLEKRTELLSRKQYPKLWAYADKKGKNKCEENKLWTKVWGFLCLGLGVFLFIPGLMKPQELQVPLFVGAIGIGAGVGSLWRSRKNRKSSFDKSAELLLRQIQQNIDGKNAKVSFDEEEMKIEVQSDEEVLTETVAYSRFEYFFEAKDIFLCVYDKKILVLKKADLIEDIASFSEFSSSKGEWVCLGEVDKE